MDVQSYALVAGERTVVQFPGRFFMIVEAGAAIDVDFIAHGSPSPEKGRSVEAGYVSLPGNWLDPQDNKFDAFALTSATNQTVRIGVSFSSADYRRTVGVVQVENANDGVATPDQLVTNAVAVTLVAANASRRGAVVVQNVSAVGGGLVRVALGVTATATTGLQLDRGMSATFHSTAAVSAIAENASAIVAVSQETRS